MKRERSYFWLKAKCRKDDITSQLSLQPEYNSSQHISQATTELEKKYNDSSVLYENGWGALLGI